MAQLYQIGTPYIIGSYSMDMMAWNDLDIDIENHAMSIGRFIIGIKQELLKRRLYGFYQYSSMDVYR